MAQHLCYLPYIPIDIVLKSFDTTRDLVNLISASPGFYRVYQHNPTAYQLATIKNAIPAPLWPDFCALNLATQYFSGPDRSSVAATDRAEVTSFLDQYFHGACPTDLPVSEESIQLARGLVHKIKWFVKDFTETVGAEARCLEKMYSYRFTQQICHGSPELGGKDTMMPYGTFGPRQPVQKNANFPTAVEPSPEFALSAAERVRLYRAFIQFELVCVLFHPLPTRSQLLQAYSGTDQHRLFFSRLEIWEVEAIACIHQYLTGIIRSACDGLDIVFENFARGLVVEPHLNTSAHHTSTEHRTFVCLSLLQYGSFHHFSSVFRKDGDCGEGAKISAGLGFMLDFAQSDQFTQLNLLRKYAEKRDPLYTAISHLRQDQALCTLKEPSTDDGSQASASYIKHYASRVGVQDEAVYLPMRALGCVFWDSKRLESKPFAYARYETRLIYQETGYDWAIDRYTRKNRPSPEQKLRNVYIPQLLEHVLKGYFGLDDGSS